MILKNPYGWIIFYSFSDNSENEMCKKGNFINHIPVNRFPGDVWELSLVAYNSIDSNAVWFKNLEIQNDWVPNDWKIYILELSFGDIISLKLLYLLK